jgi:hypothetical protein
MTPIAAAVIAESPRMSGALAPDFLCGYAIIYSVIVLILWMAMPRLSASVLIRPARSRIGQTLRAVFQAAPALRKWQ